MSDSVESEIFCPQCGYNLTGLTNWHACPECGFECHREAVRNIAGIDADVRRGKCEFVIRVAALAAILAAVSRVQLNSRRRFPFEMIAILIGPMIDLGLSRRSDYDQMWRHALAMPGWVILLIVALCLPNLVQVGAILFLAAGFWLMIAHRPQFPFAGSSLAAEEQRALDRLTIGAWVAVGVALVVTVYSLR